MRSALRFAAALVLGLALVTWLASIVARETMRAWFERDTALRAQLAVSGARQTLLAHWHKTERQALRGLLSEIAQDERIMGAAACAADGTLLTHTAEYPDRYGYACSDLLARVAPAGDTTRALWTPWRSVERLRGGSVHVSAIPVTNDGGTVGFVVLVHDLSFVERRESETQLLLLLAFGILAAAASAITLIAARLFWRGWSREVHEVLHGGVQRPEFQPILRDVRELVERIVSERATGADGGTWTPERVKHVLSRHLKGEKVVILANREPFIHERLADGTIVVRRPASGLVTALEPVVRACSGVWIAHGSGSADREVVDAHDRVGVPPGEASYQIRRVWLSREEENGYYYGFANEGLWPLCHIAHARPVFRSDDWRYYRAVNERFAEAVREEVDSEDPIVLVQDYHFALAPRMIRERLPRATVIMFWHIPWPNSQRFGICPWRKQILEGMLGADILGFHTQFDCNNFVDSADRFLEARIDREHHAVVQQGHSTLVRPYPISLEWPNRWLNTAPSVEECRAGVLAELGLPADICLGVGVDRLDYTKGLEERLLAVECLLDRFPAYRGRFVFVELAAPSRTAIERYRQLGESVERLAARINERFADEAYRPIILRHAHHEPPEVFRYFRAADVCYVSSLHDGMNLVAKEFVAARDDEHGVLVLSQFTGAARELTEALIVNPYDLEEASAALATALAMSPEEQCDRMRAMRAFLSEFNVYRWAGRMLVDAARLRSRERLSGRLTDHVVGAAGSGG